MQQINAEISSELEHKINTEQKLGKTVSYISVNEKAIGYVSISDAIKLTNYWSFVSTISSRNS